jgi:hypothetical protein
MISTNTSTPKPHVGVSRPDALSTIEDPKNRPPTITPGKLSSPPIIEMANNFAVNSAPM